MSNRKYRCVVDDNTMDKYFVKFSFKGEKKILGPFNEDYKAAFEYDRWILWLNGDKNTEKTIVNFPHQKEVIDVLDERINTVDYKEIKEYYVKFHEDHQCDNEWLSKFVNMKSLISKYKKTMKTKKLIIEDKINNETMDISDIEENTDYNTEDDTQNKSTIIINDKSKQQSNPKKRKIIKKKNDEDHESYSKRISFPAQVRNKVASRQGWCCNICNDLFDELIIVDHIKPLFCRGGNDKYNLQALCPKCDKFKTGILDKRIKELVDNGIKVDTQRIFDMQNSSFFEKECIEIPSKKELIEFQKFKQMATRERTNSPLNFQNQIHNTFPNIQINPYFNPFLMYNQNMNSMK